MSFGYFEIMADINDNTQEQNSEVQESTFEKIEDKYAPHYTDATITDKLDIFNAHDPILAGVNLKLEKPAPIEFGEIRVGQEYHASFNLVFKGCKNNVALSSDVEGVTISPNVLTPEMLDEGTNVEITLVPTEAYGLYGFIDGSIGFNGELSGLKIDLKASVKEGKHNPKFCWNHDTWSITLNESGNYQFPVLLLPEEMVPTLRIEIEVQEVAYYDSGVIHPVAAGRTKIIAIVEETENYYAARAEFTLIVTDPEVVADENFSLITGPVDPSNLVESINPNAAKPAEKVELDTEAISEPTLQSLVYPLNWEVVENDLIISPIIEDQNGFRMGVKYNEDTPTLNYKGVTYRVLDTSLGKGTYTIKFL